VFLVLIILLFLVFEAIAGGCTRQTGAPDEVTQDFLECFDSVGAAVLTVVD